MSILKYEVFLKVVELGNFTRAAEELGFTQSSVSHTIKGLENDFGFPLIIRDRSGIKLTANGNSLVPYMQEIVNWNSKLSQTVSSIKGIDSGTIRIGTFTSVSVHLLPEIMKRFSEDYPNIDFHLLEGDYDEIAHWVSCNKVDCGFLSLPSSEKLDFIPLLNDSLKAVVPKGHPLTLKDSLHIKDLMDYNFILPSEGLHHDVGRIFKSASITPKVKYFAQNDQAILSMVKNNLGVSIFPDLLLKDIPDDIDVLSFSSDYERTLGIAVHDFKLMSPAMKLFLDYVQAPK